MSKLVTNTITPQSGDTVTVSNKLNVQGILTYEDVTNVDSVGIITAQAGIHVTGGNVGVGTDGPGSKVDIASGDLEFSNKADSSALQTIQFSDGTQGRGKIQYAHNGDSMLFHTFSEERLRITSGGKTGIGTNDPSVKLHVEDSTASKAYFSHPTSNRTTLYLETDDTSARVGSTYLSGGSAFKPLQFLTSGLARLSIAADGNVGINAGGIDGTLHVKGSGGHGIIVLEAGGTSGSTNQIYLQGHNHGGTSLAEIHIEETATDQGALAFKTNNGSVVERAKIDKDGQFLLFSAGNPITSATSQAAGTTHEVFTGLESRTSTTSGGTVVCKIFNNGNIQNTNNAYGAISDIKLKENIVDASSQWNDIKNVKVRNFNFKEGQTQTQIGVVAQEIELISPGLIYEVPDKDGNNNILETSTKSVKYSVLHMKAIKALQEAMTRIETLEAEVAALKG